MNYSDIFMQSHKRIYHMKRNQWYETKTYSDPIIVQGLKDIDISVIAPGLSYNYFLSVSGDVYMSHKAKPAEVMCAKL